MTSRYNDDEWSDSDDERQTSEVETSVLLGIPDGEIEDTVDIMDPSVSRIGGYPIWCPFESSVMDRALYVCVRAWRGLKLNTKYAAKLAKKKAMEKERNAAVKAKLETERQRRSINPFALSPEANDNMTIGLGSQLFGERSSTNQPGVEDMLRNSESETPDREDESDIDALAGGMEKVILNSPKLPDEWQSAPSYRPIYLSTVSEYLPPPPKPKRNVELDDDPKKPSDQDWGLEGWEKSIDIDGAFQRFTNRVENEPEQYELKGTPLLFGSKDKVAEKLFPAPPPPPFNTKPGFAPPVSQRRAYEVDGVGKCGVCGKQRVFECQLMPNIINLFRAQKRKTEESKSAPPKNEEEQRRELLNTGMEWGTCLIFSCIDDCCSAGETECWREELVLVQWDD
ncbi:hypothetical protein Clacol_005434 [Clathrus columnatus]|uniref:Programmed cell death protein 2 C-terminal domain-containing protein n=1 Tax=Clathrus columnatus TaxID=1419009 RepID=A0AAV5ACA3_9AGAM|nr:hypothetical protein Clacol_005434 [Clathrus columnatus]